MASTRRAHRMEKNEFMNEIKNQVSSEEKRRWVGQKKALSANEKKSDWRICKFN